MKGGKVSTLQRTTKSLTIEECEECERCEKCGEYDNCKHIVLCEKCVDNL